METFFYVAGGILVLIALVVSAIGLRNDNFPSAGGLRIGVLLVALVVGATAFAAVELSQEESAHRLEEANLEADEAEAAETEAAEESGAVETPAPDEQGEGPADPAEGTAQGGDTPAGAAPAGDPAAGSQVFVDQGCGSCHTLADQGNQAVGEIGPNLDEALVNEDAAFIETSIVDPSAEVETGFGDGIMPSDYGSIIAPDDLANLVAYLQQATSGSSK